MKTSIMSCSLETKGRSSSRHYWTQGFKNDPVDLIPQQPLCPILLNTDFFAREQDGGQDFLAHACTTQSSKVKWASLFKTVPPKS